MQQIDRLHLPQYLLELLCQSVEVPRDLDHSQIYGKAVRRALALYQALLFSHRIVMGPHLSVLDVLSKTILPFCLVSSVVLPWSRETCLLGLLSLQYGKNHRVRY